MVFISFPSDTTSEEENLLKKYEKLERKRKAIRAAQKPEVEVEKSVKPNKAMEAIDAKLVIEQLKKKGALPQIINSGQKREFKRKMPANSIKKPKVVEEEKREEISYDDDLFDD